jgi:hypothetical protein
MRIGYLGVGNGLWRILGQLRRAFVLVLLDGELAREIAVGHGQHREDLTLVRFAAGRATLPGPKQLPEIS